MLENARCTQIRQHQPDQRPTGWPHGQSPHPGWVKARPGLDRGVGAAPARVARRARTHAVRGHGGGTGEAGPERGRG